MNRTSLEGSTLAKACARSLAVAGVTAATRG